MNKDAAASLETPYVSYHLSPEGYHVVTFRESSRRAVDQWAECIVRVMAAETNKPCICTLYDIRISGMMPLVYMTEKAAEILKCFPGYPPLRIASVYERKLFIRLIEKFIDLVINRQRDKTLFFRAAELENATQWLHEEVAANKGQAVQV